MFSIQSDHYLTVSPNFQPLFSRSPTTPNYTKGVTITPRVVVVHYTASGSLDGTAAHCCNDSSGVSYHLLIGQRGHIIQLAPLNARCWHAGTSKWQDEADVNSFGIGIGLINWGPLKRGKNNTFLAWPDNFTRAITSHSVPLYATHKHAHLYSDKPGPYWESYPQEQLDTLRHVLAALLHKYPITAIVGHDDITPGRKLDPGPALPSLPVCAPWPNHYDLLKFYSPSSPPFVPPTPKSVKECYTCNECHGQLPCNLWTTHTPTPDTTSPSLCPFVSINKPVWTKGVL